MRRIRLLFFAMFRPRAAVPCLCVCALLLAALPSAGFGMEIEPFQTRNQNPLIRVFGIPSIGSAAVMPAGKLEGTLQADLANNFAPAYGATDSVMLDGETYTFTLSARYGIAKDLELGMDIPYLANNGGFMDGFIEGFHDFFGLPEGSRKSYPKNRILYQYTRNGVTRVLVNEDSSGIGDISLTGAWQLYRGGAEGRQKVALHGAIKLPTGNSNRLYGSGSTDFSLWLTASDDFQLPLGHLTLYGAAGGMAMTNGDVLEDQQRNLAAFGSLGIGWSPLDWFAIKVQTDGHTSLYTGSNLEEVNCGSIQITAGGTFGLTKSTFLDIGVIEDLVVNTSPDVVFHLALRSRF
jgi:hypothetical protein